jgi:hypothetical protein
MRPSGGPGSYSRPLEDPADVEKGIAAALAHDGPVLVCKIFRVCFGGGSVMVAPNTDAKAKCEIRNEKNP